MRSAIRSGKCRTERVCSTDGSKRCTALCHDIAAEIRRIENRLNRFDEASDVWQINQNTFYDKCPADPELLGIFADALRYREMTGGAFDIAIQTPEYLPGESCFAVDPAWLSAC